MQRGGAPRGRGPPRGRSNLPGNSTRRPAGRPPGRTAVSTAPRVIQHRYGTRYARTNIPSLMSIVTTPPNLSFASVPASSTLAPSQPAMDLAQQLANLQLPTPIPSVQATAPTSLSFPVAVGLPAAPTHAVNYRPVPQTQHSAANRTPNAHPNSNQPPNSTSANPSSIQTAQSAATDTTPVPCGMCSELVYQSGIGCDRCSRWFHPAPTCVSLEPDDITIVQRYGGQRIHFVCTFCLIGETTTGGSATAALSHLHQSVRSLSTAVNKLLSRNPNPQQQASLSDSPTQLRTIIRAESYEIAEREKRKLSLIIRGITGPNNQMLPDDEYLAFFRSLATHLIGDTNLSITKLDRLSSTMSRVTFNNALTRSALLNAAPLLRTTSCNNIFIQKDLTAIQRKEQFDRRTERRQRASHHAGPTFHSSQSISQLPSIQRTTTVRSNTFAQLLHPPVSSSITPTPGLASTVTAPVHPNQAPANYAVFTTLQPTSTTPTSAHPFPTQPVATLNVAQHSAPATVRFTPLAAAHQTQPSCTGATTALLPSTSAAVPLFNLPTPISAAPLPTTHVTNPATSPHNPFSASLAAPSATTHGVNPANMQHPEAPLQPLLREEPSSRLPHQDVLTAPLIAPQVIDQAASMYSREVLRHPLPQDNHAVPHTTSQAAYPYHAQAGSYLTASEQSLPPSEDAAPPCNVITTHSLNLRPAQSSHRTNVNTITIVTSPPRLPASSPSTQVSEATTQNQATPTDFHGTF